MTNRDDLARKLNEAGAWCGTCGFDGGIDACPDCLDVCHKYADVAIETLTLVDPSTVKSWDDLSYQLATIVASLPASWGLQVPR